MPHETPLIATIVASLSLAFVFGALANRLRVSPLVGYLLAGVAVGPFTPGFVADQKLATELAEIGVILLMFGVGLHFSIKDLLSVWRTAVLGATVEIAMVTLLGTGLAFFLSWTVAQGLVFGLALSVASTVVLTRTLHDRRLLTTERGRIAVGWLVVEDLVMILALVMLPAIAGLFEGAGAERGVGARPRIPPDQLMATVFITVGKVSVFAAAMLLVGRRIIPWILHYIAHTGSRELFRLAVLSMALGIALGASILFDVSVALGAFFAGMVLAESELSQQAAEESLPLRDAFAVLFFVSVGMLVDPAIIIRQPGPVLATLLIVLLGKASMAYLIVRALGHSMPTALMIGASLAQIGEFSFILTGLAVVQGLLPAAARDLVLAASILSIIVNPAWFYMLERLRLPAEQPATGPVFQPEALVAVQPIVPTTLRDHFVVAGHGRVGRVIAEGLRQKKLPILVIEERQDIADEAKGLNYEVLVGNAASADLVEAANLKEARWLFVAIPNGFEAGQIVQQAKTIKPELRIVARAHSDAEVSHLRAMGADEIVMGEREIALGMLELAFEKFDAPT